MGACVSVHKDQDSGVRLGLGFGPKKTAHYAAGPTKPEPAPPPISSPIIGGSTDEMFFESQGWLESDCEDFYSVNGDFTPSRGNTPMHVMATPRNAFVNAAPSPRKKLADLFRENAEIDGRGERRRDNVVEREEERESGALQCCLPGLNRRSLSSNQGKKIVN